MDITLKAVESQQIAVDKIKPSPFQARQTFDDDSLQELTASIKQEGLLQPVVVRALADGSFELIAGERRLRAVKGLGWPTIDARVLSNVSDQDASLMGLIENLQRAGLNPIEEARGYKRLSEPPHNLSQADIAQRLGKSQPVVAKMLALLDLPQEIQEIIPRGIISEGHCRSLRQITDKTKQIALAQQAEKEGWSVKETEQQVNKVLAQNGQVKNPKKKSAAAQHPDQNGISFKENGARVIITAPYDRTTSFETFAAQLKTELTLWDQKHPLTDPSTQQLAKGSVQ